MMSTTTLAQQGLGGAAMGLRALPTQKAAALRRWQVTSAAARCTCVGSSCLWLDVVRVRAIRCQQFTKVSWDDEPAPEG